MMVAFAVGACSSGPVDMAGPPEPTPLWDACAFVSVDEAATALGVADSASIHTVRGAADHDWLTFGEGTARLQTALSQCTYDSGSDAGDAPKLTIVARLAGMPDRSVGQTRRLLERQGYVPEEIDAPCADGALWLDGEMHAFFEEPSSGNACSTVDANASQASSPLYANAVFFLDNKEDEEERRKQSLSLVSAAVRPIRQAMGEIRNYTPKVIDGGVVTQEVPAVLVGDEVGYQDYPMLAAQVVCERAIECCASSDLSVSAIPTDSVGGCSSFLAIKYGLALVGAAEGLESGRLEYNGTEASACLRNYQSDSCDAILDRIAETPCFTAAWSPLVPEGGSCSSSLECATGYCAPSAGGANLFDAGSASEIGDASSGSADGGTAHDAGAAVLGSCQPLPANAVCTDGGCDAGTCDDGGRCERSIPWCKGL